MVDHISRGHGADKARRSSKSSTPSMDRIEMADYGKEPHPLVHVEDRAQGKASVTASSEEPEPHVSLSTILAVFVSATVPRVRG